MQRLADIAGEDKAEAYVEKLHHIENRTDFKNLPGDSELRLIHASVPTLEINELESSTRLINRDVSEILDPGPAREELKDVDKKTLHLNFCFAHISASMSDL